MLGCDVSHGTLLTQNGAVCWLIFPHGCEEPKSDTGCSRDELFGVCGGAAELGSVASNTVSEMFSASALFALKYLH